MFALVVSVLTAVREGSSWGLLLLMAGAGLYSWRFDVPVFEAKGQASDAAVARFAGLGLIVLAGALATLKVAGGVFGLR